MKVVCVVMCGVGKVVGKLGCGGVYLFFFWVRVKNLMWVVVVLVVIFVWWVFFLVCRVVMMLGWFVVLISVVCRVWFLLWFCI